MIGAQTSRAGSLFASTSPSVASSTRDNDLRRWLAAIYHLYLSHHRRRGLHRRKLATQSQPSQAPTSSLAPLSGPKLSIATSQHHDFCTYCRSISTALSATEVPLQTDSFRKLVTLTLKTNWPSHRRLIQCHHYDTKAQYGQSRITSTTTIKNTIATSTAPNKYNDFNCHNSHLRYNTYNTNNNVQHDHQSVNNNRVTNTRRTTSNIVINHLRTTESHTTPRTTSNIPIYHPRTTTITPTIALRDNTENHVLHCHHAHLPFEPHCHATVKESHGRHWETCFV